jgi:RHH-type proline utilization regulon transcriptional repressor/proline dehydrogenase/delta 1-pyrroline-5-carboxylate dehydrogenase
VQREIYADVQAMLIGAMQTLVVGDPQSLDTDVGPVIDADARDQLLSYIETRRADVLYQTQAPSEGYFVPATLIEIDSLDQIQREQFGPVLHIMSYAREDLESQVDALMAKGYGLTAAIQSRNERFIQTVSARLRVGNLYVNRNQVGAVVGSQPFGGEGLSGTGPKAGGPGYLSAFQAAPSTRTSEGDSLPLTESEDPLMRDQLERALDLQARQLTAQAIRHEDCPGPTGELNRLSEYPRGVWLALGASAAPLVDEALGFNNRVIWLSETDVTKRTDERLTLLLCQEITLDWLSSLAFDGVLVATTADCLQSIAQKLTERTGPLIPVVTQPGSGSQLTCERHLCIDTTASGGNPGLLLSAAQ